MSYKRHKNTIGTACRVKHGKHVLQNASFGRKITTVLKVCQ